MTTMRIPPLPRPHRPVEITEQGDRRPECLRIQDADLLRPSGVVTLNSQRRVPLGGRSGKTVEVRRGQFRRVHRIFPLIARVARQRPGRCASLQFGQGLAGYDVQVPRLEVTARWSPRRCSQHAFEYRFGYYLAAGCTNQIRLWTSR